LHICLWTRDTKEDESQGGLGTSSSWHQPAGEVIYLPNRMEGWCHGDGNSGRKGLWIGWTNIYYNSDEFIFDILQYNHFSALPAENLTF